MTRLFAHWINLPTSPDREKTLANPLVEAGAGVGVAGAGVGVVEVGHTGPGASGVVHVGPDDGDGGSAVMVEMVGGVGRGVRLGP